MQQPLATPYTIKETLAQLNPRNEIDLLHCNRYCSYNQWLVNAKVNSKLFLNKLQSENKYVFFHKLLRNITSVSLTKNNIAQDKDIDKYINAIDTFITKECSYEFFDAILNHFYEINPHAYDNFLEPSLLLKFFLRIKKLQHIIFLAKYILEKKKCVSLQQMNNNILLSLQENYVETTHLLFKITNGLEKNTNNYNICLDHTVGYRLAVLQTFITTNINKKDLLIEIVLSIFLQNSYLQDADAIPKLINFLIEQDINLVTNCYNILSRLKYNKAKENEGYVLAKTAVQDEIMQISNNCSVVMIETELKKLAKKYPYFFIPVIEKRYYELKLNIDLSNIENNDSICYIRYIIQQTKELIKIKKLKDKSFSN